MLMAKAAAAATTIITTTTTTITMPSLTHFFAEVRGACVGASLADARKYAMKILQFARGKVYERVSRRH